MQPLIFWNHHGAGLTLAQLISELALGAVNGVERLFDLARRG